MSRQKQQAYDSISENKKLKYIFLVLFFAVLLCLAFIYRSFIWPFLFAMIFYAALKPFHDRITKYLKNRFLSSLTVTTLFIIVVLVPVVFLLFALTDQTFQFYNFLTTQIDTEKLISYVEKSAFFQKLIAYFSISEGELVARILGYLQKAALGLFSNATQILTFSFNLAVNFFFMILMLLFLFQEAFKLEDIFYHAVPFPREIEKDVINRLKEVIKVLIAGNLLVMIFQGVLVGIGFMIAGIKIPLFAGSVAAVFSLIPVVGTSFVWLPAVIYLIVLKKFGLAVFLGVWCLAWYLMLENVLKPSLFGKKLHFHPLIFFFLLLGSIQTFGLAGVILGPVILTLFYSLWEIYKIS